MKKVCLQFTDEQDLLRFTTVVSGTHIEMIVNDLTLTFICDDAEIELAERGFNAKVIAVDAIPS